MLRRFITWLTPPKRMVGFTAGVLMFSIILPALAIFPVISADETPDLATCRGCLDTVILTSPQDGWATTADFFGNAAYILHLHHGAWNWEFLPLSDPSFITSISADATGDVWATAATINLNKSGDTYAFLYEHNGHWSTLSALLPYSFDTLQMFSATDGWAMEDRGETSATRFAHFDGQSWQDVPGPGTDQFDAMDFTSPTDGWAVGAHGAIAHYYQHAWHQVASPTTEELISVRMLSTRDGWAVGANGVTLHFNGKRWRSIAVTTIPIDDLAHLTMLSDSEGWATAADYFGAPRVWHFAAGVWQDVPFPTDEQFTSLAMSGPDEGWAVGIHPTQLSAYEDILAGNGILAHDDHGSWHVMDVPPMPEPPAIIAQRIALAAIVVLFILFCGFILFGASAFPPKTAIRSWWTRIGTGFVLISDMAALVGLLGPIAQGTYDNTLAAITTLGGTAFAFVGMICGIVLLFRFQKAIHPQTPAEMLAERDQKLAALMAGGHRSRASDAPGKEEVRQ